MSKEQDIQENIEDVKEEADELTAESISEESGEENGEENDDIQHQLTEANDKYVRLYADFENYKRIAERNKEELLKYANEEIISDILTVIDHLELALQHSADSESSDSLAEGVTLTLKELKGVLEKHGLTTIEAMGKPFDPAVHHAMSQIESEDTEENIIVKEFRKGYKLKDRVLRAAMVGVSVKPSDADNDTGKHE